VADTRPLLWRVSRLAQELDISRSHAYRLISAGKIPHVRVGGKSVRIPFTAVQRFIEEHTTSSGGLQLPDITDDEL
jgi:excisionase family DNA binding protein